LTLFFIKHCDSAAISLDGLANAGDVAEGLTTVLDLQKPPVKDPRWQGAQMDLTLKMTFLVTLCRFLSYLV
jgi:hypothetical protein